ncbi:MAG: helix-turn-helix domain-containing protein [Clostridia bacterium]|nr:helix-turn-helix domain-containing protein [Clostridia bacterium]
MKPTRPVEPIEAFGRRIRDLRRERHLTQQAVAERLQIHRTTYTKYETGCVAPDQQGLLRLAEIFDVTVDSLLGRDTTVLADSDSSLAGLSVEERELVQLFRRLTEEEQQIVVKRVRASLSVE